LIGDMPPRLAGMQSIRLVKCLTNGGGDNRVLAFRDMRQCIAHPVNPSTLPGSLKDPRDCGLEARMCVADDQPDPVEPPGSQGSQKIRPEGLRLRGTDPEADNFSAAFGIRGDGDYRSDGDDPAALPLPEISGVQPDVGPFAGERAVQEFTDPLVDILAQLGNGAFRDPAQPHGLHQVIDPASGHAADPCFLDHGDQSLLGHLPGLQKAREIAALSQLRDFEIQRAQPGIEHALSIAVSPCRAVLGSLVPSSADQAFDIGLHDQLEDGLRDRP
jgi:hypothetical protein